MEEMLRDGKSWGIEDSIKHLEKLVEEFDAKIAPLKSELEELEDKRNSFHIGLVNLRHLATTTRES